MGKECVIYLRDADSIEIDSTKQYIIEVRGWVMLAKVVSGVYRIKFKYSDDFHGYTVDFYKLKGKKVLARHHLQNLMFMTNECSDLNGIILKGEYTGNIK